MAEWTTDQIQARIRGEATHQGVDPDLALAVATQESSLSPTARGDNGNSLGLFQLQPAAAIDVGVNPQWRHEPGVNIYGGIAYLKQKLQQSQGNVEQALRRYNGGGDPNYVQHVMRFFKPGVAEAAARPQAGTYTDADVQEALKALQTPQESTGGTYTDADVQTALQSLQGAQQAPGGTQTPAPVSQTAPVPQASPRAQEGGKTGNMERFAALPSIQGLSPEDRQARTREFQALRPDLQEEFLRSEEPPSDLTVDIEKPSPPVQGTTGPITPDQVDEALRRELAPAQQGMSGLLLGGAAGTAGRAVGQVAQRALPWLGRVAGILPVAGEAAGSYGGRQANVALGNEQPGMGGDVLAAAGPVVARAVGAIAPAIVRRLPGSAGAQHEMMAERLRAQPAAQAPPTTAQTLYRAVAQQGNPAIPAQQLRQTAQDVLAAEMRHGASLRNPTIVGVARDIDALAARYPNGIPMDRLYETMQRVGEMVGAARRSGGTETRALNRLYASFHEAIEHASQTNIPGAETLRQAIAASRQEHAVRRLGRLVGQGRGIEEQQATGYTFVKGKKMLNEFDRLVADDDVFRGSFTHEQLQEMRSLFQEASRLPALPTPSGTPRGSGAAATRAALGSLFGGPAGAAIAVSGHEVIARAMMTAPGRAMLRAALEGRGGLTPQALAVLNTALREQLSAEKP